MSRRSRAAVARSAGGERSLLIVIGLVLLVLAVLALLVGYGVFGNFRALRPVLDPIAVGWVTSHAAASRWIAIGAGVVLIVVGIVWGLASLRPERRPDMLLSAAPGERLTVEYSAVCDAVRQDAESIEGVARARIRIVGSEQRPALRMTLNLAQDADVRDVWAELDGRVLARARQAFDVDAVPAAVRLELDASRSVAPRVL